MRMNAPTAQTSRSVLIRLPLFKQAASCRERAFRRKPGNQRDLTYKNYMPDEFRPRRWRAIPIIVSYANECDVTTVVIRNGGYSATVRHCDFARPRNGSGNQAGRGTRCGYPRRENCCHLRSTAIGQRRGDRKSV